MYAHGMTEYAPDDYLALSGIQHFSFCRRQWALIHVEQLWQENLLTVEGRILHEKTHSQRSDEKRADRIITRSMPVQSRRLGASGVCDMVEFIADSKNGVPISGHNGLWLPMPVEYKHGRPKPGDADRLQLCAQAICLEEMLCCEIGEGHLFYGETRRREQVVFDGELRMQVENSLAEMHAYMARNYTPKCKPTAACRSCSLRDVCLPVLCKNRSAKQYIREHLEDNA